MPEHALPHDLREELYRRLVLEADSHLEALGNMRSLAEFSLEVVQAELAGRYPPSLNVAGGSWLEPIDVGAAHAECLGSGCTACAGTGFVDDSDRVAAVA